MRLFVIPALVGVLVLGGCVTVGGAFDVACSSLGAAHQGFLKYTEENPVQQNILDVELVTYTNAQALCADRGTLTITQAGFRIAAAAAEIWELLRTSERQTGVMAAP